MNALRTRLLTLGCLAGIACLGVLAFSNSLANGFYFDDSHVLVSNYAIRSLKNIPRFFHDTTTFSSSRNNLTYRPVFTLSLALNYAVCELRPYGYHAVNLAIHIVCGMLIWLIARRLVREWLGADALPAMLAACAGAAWFVVAPVNAETVNYTMCRAASLATLFYLLGFALYLHARTRHWAWYVPVCACMVLSVMSKDIGGTLGLLFIAYEAWDWGRAAAPVSRARRVVPVALFAAVVLLYALRVKLFIGMDALAPVFTSGTLADKLSTHARGQVHYLRQFLFPTAFPIDPVDFGVTAVSDPRSLLAIGTLASLYALVLCGRRRLPVVTFGLLWYFIALIPEQTFTDLNQPINYHRPYIALPGVCVAAAALLGHAWKALARVWTPRAAGIACAGFCAVAAAWYIHASRAENAIWADNLRLWQVAVEHAPSSGRAQMNLGLEYMARGSYEKAEEHFLECRRLWPDYLYVHVNLGILYRAMGRDADADSHFRHAYQLDPKHGAVVTWLVYDLQKRGMYAESIGPLDGVITDKPESAPFRKLRGIAYYKLGRHAEAAADLEHARRTLADDRELILHLGLSYLSSGLHPQALALYDEWLARHPDDTDSLFNRAYTLQCLRRYDEALAAWDTVLRVSPSPKAAANRAWVEQQSAGRHAW